MNIKNLFRIILPTMAAAMMLFGLATPASAHETDCPYCKLKVVQDTPEQDNEVVLRLGNKRIEYRCVMCAIAQAKTKYKSKDLTILAPSNVKGKPVTINKKGSEWSVSPANAVFVYQKGSHDKCETLYRAVADKDAANSYIKAKGLAEAKQLTLKEMVEQSK